MRWVLAKGSHILHTKTPVQIVVVSEYGQVNREAALTAHAKILQQAWEANFNHDLGCLRQLFPPGAGSSDESLRKAIEQ
jgi:hypothetical protein